MPALSQRCSTHLGQRGGKPKGSISFLITGDEEGIAVNGTPKLLKWAAERGEKFDHCILAEPSNQEELGDTIKIGRRGSLNGHLIVSGTQGHVAYPQRANNPIRGLVTLVSALQAEPLDQGSAQFAPSHLEFTSVDVGNKTVNLIPGEARARFNIRFNDNHTLDSLKKLIEQRAAKAAGGKIKFTFQWEPSNAGVFVTKAGPFTDLVAAAVGEEPPAASRRCRRPAARRTRDLSRTTVLWSSSVWSARRCIKSTSACRLRTCRSSPESIVRSSTGISPDGRRPRKTRAQYSTFIRYSPSGGATGPQAARSRALSAFARSSGLHLPSPTRTSEPTIERT